jgi:hypothetical protein
MELLAVSVLLVSFFFLLLVGVPVAYSIGRSALLTMFVSVMPLPAVTTVARRVATGIDLITCIPELSLWLPSAMGL